MVEIVDDLAVGPKVMEGPVVGTAVDGPVSDVVDYMTIFPNVAGVS